MAVQQCRVSRTRVRIKKAAKRYKGMQAGSCSMCGAARMPHRVCRACGHYGDRQVLSITAE